jgi:hypothetical protein
MKKFKKFKEYNDYDELIEQRSDRSHKLSEKRMLSALRRRDAIRLIDIEDEYN